MAHLCKPVLFVNPCICIHDIMRRGQGAPLICCHSNLGLFTLQHTWHLRLLVCGLRGMTGRLMSMCINDLDWCANVISHMDARYSVKPDERESNYFKEIKFHLVKLGKGLNVNG